MPRSRPSGSPTCTEPSSAGAVGKITDDLDVLLTFYDYPAEHWVHLRTSNPIESTFATAPGVTKGRAAAPPLWRWPSSSSRPPKTRRAVNAPHLVALVRAGATFINGQLVGRPAQAVTA